MNGDADRLMHDVAHLLTAILGAVDSTLARHGLDAATLRDMRLARQAVEQAAALMGRNAAAPGPVVLSVNHFLRDAAPLLARVLGPTIRLALALEEPDPHTRADPAQLGRVLTNLAANARDAMAEGGVVTLRSGYTVTPDGRYALIAMEDTGAGIAPALLTQMFNPGFTTREAVGGTGLGLSIAHDMVQQSGGFITVGSTPGLGTTMRIQLPLVRAPTRGTVLLVEDEAVVRHLAERALLQAGWRVLTAGSGEAALVTAKTARPDIVVSDMALPGMSGLALVAALRTIWPNLPALLVSGYADSVMGDDACAGNAVFLAKPYALAALVGAVDGLVRD